MIIGLTGTIGAGKGTVVEYLLSRHNFTHYSVRDVLNTELSKLGKPLTRENMFWIATKLREEKGSGYFMEALLAEAQAKGGDAIIESIRTMGEVETMRQKSPHFILFAVDADPKTRYERIVKRNSSTDHITFQKFIEDEEKENRHGEKWQINLPGCIAAADYRFLNDTAVDVLFSQVEEVITKLK